MPVMPKLEIPAEPAFLHPHVLRQMLREDPPMAFNIVTRPPISNSGTREEIMSDLIENLDNMDHSGSGHVVFLLSEVVDRFIQPPAAAENDPGTIDGSSRGCLSIMPSGAYLPLERSDLTRYVEIHALTGVRIHFVWPPTAHNIAILQSYFRTGGRSSTESQVELCQELRGGNSIIQRPGQIVLIPPYCSTVTFATKMSAAVQFGFRHTEGIPLRLRHADLLPGQTRLNTGDDSARRAKMLTYEIKQLAKDIENLLALSGPAPPAQQRLVLSLAKEWRTKSVSFRSLCAMCLPAIYLVQAGDNFRRLWDAAIEFHAFEWCPACDALVTSRGCGHVQRDP